MFVLTFVIIFLGCPVAIALSGGALLFFALGLYFDFFQFGLFELMANRIFGIMSNDILLAIPYFIFMGAILKNSKIAEEMLLALGKVFGSIRGGLGITVIIVGTLLAASTSIVAASVISMGIISLPIMLKSGYSEKYSTGVILAAGTLGQIVPPSIVLIVLADQVGISVGDVFKGALAPSLLLITLLLLYTLLLGKIKPELLPPIDSDKRGLSLLKEVIIVSFPPLILIIVVLGSIFGGIATPSEAGALGAISALLLSLFKFPSGIINVITESAKETVLTSSMVLFILVGSTAFALVFRAFGGDHLIREFLISIPGGKVGFVLFASLLIFILGFFIDFFEITFIVVPFLIPAAQILDINLVWLTILIALNMQTSFLTPPFGFSIFFLRGVVSKEIDTSTIFKGVIPFIIIQVLCLSLVYFFPALVTWNLN